MKLLDFAWDTITNIGQRDYDSLRLILDEKLVNPILSRDSRGWVVKLPVPKLLDGELYTLHGLNCDHDENAWTTIWRLFKASLYHASLHVAYSDFTTYAPWAKGKDASTATYSISLVEDLSVTMRAIKRWPAVLNDIIYSNYLSSLRVYDFVRKDIAPLRYSTKLLLSLWGVNRLRGDSKEDKEIESLASEVRALVTEALRKKKEDARNLLVNAAQSVYSAVSRKGLLPEVPYMPYTEWHGKSTLFDSKLIARNENSSDLLVSAYQALGLEVPSSAGEKSALDDSAEAYHDLNERREKLARVVEKYEKLISPTKLYSVEFPAEDYGMFLRIRSALSGPIRSIRDQLRLIKNVLDDTPGHESGQIDMQTAMQVVASGKFRPDVFMRDEPTDKDEAWAILIDASKSVSSFSHEVKGIATCLSEVAKELIPKQDQWAVYSFNDSFQIIKDFTEAYSTESKARIGGLVQRNATLLPDAMAICNRILSSKPVDLRIMVVVSDGYPTGYIDIEKKLLSTIKEVSRSGTLLIGVGIDSNAIEEYFTVNCVVGNPYLMMKSFVKSYLELSSLF